MLPVTIRAGALADHIPHADLTVSPGHAMFVDGQLVPAWRPGERRHDHAGARSRYRPLPSIWNSPATPCCWPTAPPPKAFSTLPTSASQFHDATARPGPAPSQPFQSRLEDGFALAGDPGPATANRAGAAPGRRTKRRPTRLRRRCRPRPCLLLGPGTASAPRHRSRSRSSPATVRYSASSPTHTGPICAGAGLGSGCHAFETALPLGLEGPITVRRAADGATLAHTRQRRRWRRKPRHCSPHKPAGTAPRSPPYPAPEGLFPGLPDAKACSANHLHRRRPSLHTRSRRPCGVGTPRSRFSTSSPWHSASPAAASSIPASAIPTCRAAAAYRPGAASSPNRVTAGSSIAFDNPCGTWNRAPDRPRHPMHQRHRAVC